MFDDTVTINTPEYFIQAARQISEDCRGNERQLERRAESLFDAIDRVFMTSATMSQAMYDKLCKDIARILC